MIRHASYIDVGHNELAIQNYTICVCVKLFYFLTYTSLSLPYTTSTAKKFMNNNRAMFRHLFALCMHLNVFVNY